MLSHTLTQSHTQCAGAPHHSDDVAHTRTPGHARRNGCTQNVIMRSEGCTQALLGRTHNSIQREVYKTTRTTTTATTTHHHTPRLKCSVKSHHRRWDHHDMLPWHTPPAPSRHTHAHTHHHPCLYRPGGLLAGHHRVPGLDAATQHHNTPPDRARQKKKKPYPSHDENSLTLTSLLTPNPLHRSHTPPPIKMR